jgi:galactokinase
MQLELSDAFRARFGRNPELGARAPGRVNLMGGHTDYNQGLVMPCAIDRDTLVLGALRPDSRFRVWARDLGEEAEFEAAAPKRRGSWIDYLQGVVFALEELGIAAQGLDLAISSRVPRGSGLSSSAALSVAVTTLIDRAQGLGLGAAERARVAHRAENHFVGVGCGILDQFASALGQRDCALRIDCRSQAALPVPLPGSRLRVLVAHSGVTRELAGAGASYRDRVAECRAALEAARDAGIAPPEATALRDLVPEDLPRLEGVLPPPLLRRTRHVLTENRRVDAFATALQTGDLEAAGALLREGQRSLRDDYQVTIPEIDTLCEIANALPGVIGSRLTGAGFGGCTLHLVEAEATRECAQAIADGFERRYGRLPPVLEVRPSDGASAFEPSQESAR